jgi:hypothetical protein
VESSRRDQFGQPRAEEEIMDDNRRVPRYNVRAGSMICAERRLESCGSLGGFCGQLIPAPLDLRSISARKKPVT